MAHKRRYSVLIWIFISTWVQADTLVTLQDVSFHPERSASATVISLNETTLSAQIQATIKSINVQVSETVTKGQILLKLDCANYQLNLQSALASEKSAQAQLMLAETQLKRAKNLRSKDLAAAELEETREAERAARAAELEQANINIKRAKLDVSRCQIAAPFDAVIQARLAAEGQLASVGSALLQLVETDQLQLSAQVSPSDVDLILRSPKIIFDYGQHVPVKILHVGGIVNQQTRTQELRFNFEGNTPLPGTAGKLVWQDPRPFLPARYIIQRNDQFGIFINHEGIAKFVPLNNVKPGRPHPVDLPPDAHLVTENLGLLQPGDKL